MSAPITFSAYDVCRLLNGTKTMTRREITEHTKRWTVGERLWVREPWWYAGDMRDGFDRERVRYMATHRAVCPEAQWAHANTMSQPMSRLTLTVKTLREERLQSMLPSEAAAEGYDSLKHFRSWWDHAHYATWSENPRVIVLRFTVTQRG